MSPSLKVVAVTNREPYNYKVLVEIDRDTIQRLICKSYTQCPDVGAELEIGGVLKRLSALERRENDMMVISQIISKLANPEPEETE